jgi:hypothetical protein
MSKPNKPKFHLTLEALPDPTDPAGYRRLRALLKAALRHWRLKCVFVTASDAGRRHDAARAFYVDG